MSFQGVGDLAQSFQLRRDNAQLQEAFKRLSGELSSGRKSDLGRAVSGDFGALSGIERSLRAISAYDTAVTETGLMADAAQSALEFVRDKAASISPSFLIADADYQPGMVDAAAVTAASGFADVVSALNIRVGDRSVFAGTATDGPALAGAETMLTELETLIAAETTGAGVETVVETWFAPGGGFELTGYLGNTDVLANIPVSQDERATLDVTASDPAIREILTGLALGALLDRGALAGDTVERAAIAEAVGGRLLEADYTITETRARVGVTQERIEDARIRNGAETQSLELARASILEADPYETAAQLAALEVQLETLYAVTARLSRLTLADYL